MQESTACEWMRLTAAGTGLGEGEDVRVKLLAQDQELYVFAESRERIAKERRMRRRQLKWLWQRLKQLSTMQKLTRESLLTRLCAAQSKASAAWRLLTVELSVQGTSFCF